jgi:hypothetical protein
VPNAVEIRDGWKLYIVAGGVKVRILLKCSNILNFTPPATIYSLQSSLISTTLGTYLSRIMIDSLMMTF